MSSSSSSLQNGSWLLTQWMFNQVQTNRRFSTPSLEPLEDMVICPIDLNLLEDPRLLPCGMRFCCTA
ncbi:hypothetical protein AHF37_06694 [Paragonimus kellicotti]|nr:hypothetical protein AHF37_06694 [Paragonimus kellicotti]